MITFMTDQYPRAAVPGDFNRDGIADLAMVHDGAETVGVLTGSIDSGTYQLGGLQTYPVGTDPYWICTADFNADAILDLAVPSPIDGTFTVLLGDGSDGVGTGTFLPQSAIDTVGLPSSILCGDFNSDGLADVVTVGYMVGSLTVHPGQGDGTFGDLSDYVISHSAFHGSAVDLDGDRILDIALTDVSLNAIQLMKGGGQNGKADGSFSDMGSFPVDSSQKHLGIGDFNSDGIVDLAVPSDSAASFGILLGQGQCLDPR
jgi:hypothetical protein